MLLVVAVATALVAGVAAGVIAGVLVSAAWGAWIWRSGPGAVRRTLGAEPADAEEHARLHNLVEGLSTNVGVPKPELHVLADPAPNALVYGRAPRQATLVVTSGLLERLNRVELEGVLARELVGIRNLDVLPGTVAVPVLRSVPVRALAERLRRTAVPTPVVTADANGASITRYPPALVAAYEKIRATGIEVQVADRSLAHLWLVPPADTAAPDLHPTLDERIAALREL